MNLSLLLVIRVLASTLLKFVRHHALPTKPPLLKVFFLAKGSSSSNYATIHVLMEGFPPL